jgi:hypothetical protein
MRFLPLQRFPARGSGCSRTGVPTSGRLRLQVFSTSWRFNRPEPAGLVSCRIRSWGSPFRAFLLPCSRSPSPAPLPSCCWNAFRLTRGPTARREHRNAAPETTAPHVGDSSERPSTSGLCSTRESATSLRRVRPAASAWLSWDSPLQGVLPRRADNGLHRVSPHEVARLGDKSSARALYRVLLPVEIGWSLSRLPTLLGFTTL